MELKHKVIHQYSWEVFKLYLKNCLVYFDSYDDPDYEQAELRNEIQEILDYDISTHEWELDEGNYETVENSPLADTPDA